MLGNVLLGSGGHARVLLDILRLEGKRELYGVVSLIKPESSLSDVPWLFDSDEACIAELSPQSVKLINGLGSIGRVGLRANVYERYTEAGFQFESLIHPTAVIAAERDFLDGVQVMAGVVVQPGVTLEPNVLLNTGACVDHDCYIGRSTHIAPGVVLSGNVNVGHNTHVGTGARVIQGIKIGSRCVIGAGVTILSDVPDDTVVHPRQSIVWSG